MVTKNHSWWFLVFKRSLIKNEKMRSKKAVFGCRCSMMVLMLLHMSITTWNCSHYRYSSCNTTSFPCTNRTATFLFQRLVHVLSMLFQEHRKYRHASFRPSYALHERRRHFFLFTSNWHPYLSQTFGLSLNLAAQVAPRHSLFLQTQVNFFLHLFSTRIL